MRQHTKRLADMRKFEDPRLSFSTPEFRESQRIFTENFKVSRNPYPSLTLSPYHAPHRASRPVSMDRSRPHASQRTLPNQWSARELC